MPVVAPGSRYSARIGNKLTGAFYDRISTFLTVTPNNSLLIYKYAIVLQSPNHPERMQPKLVINVIDSFGKSASCSSFEVAASRTNTVFKYQNRNNIVYRNWTTAAVNLRDYIGQTVTISVTTNDCTEGAHFGYAYFDAECFTSRVYVSQGCETPSQGITISAPEGFETYKWQNGDTARSIFVRNPMVSNRYSVRLKPYYTLSNNCDLTMDFIIPDTFPIQNIKLTRTSCNPADTGLLVRRFINTRGCDSLVTIRTNWLRGGDTTFLNFKSCNPSDTGVFVTKLNNIRGCDSFVQKKTLLLRGRDTTYLNLRSCYARDTGFVVLRYVNTLGCDSFVSKKTILLRGGDTTWLTPSSSCNPRDTGIFHTKLINEVGCDSFIRQAILYKPMSINTQTEPTPCQDPAGQIRLTSINGSKPPYSFSLNDSLHFQNDKIFSSLFGRYYTLFVRDSVRCINRFDSILVERKGCGVFIPTAFSPNDDGINDEFKIFAPPNYIKTIKSYRIFSRWGNLVYESPNKNVPFDTFTDWWNGFGNNQKRRSLTSDVFVYSIEVDYFEPFKLFGETHLKGDVTLMLGR